MREEDYQHIIPKVPSEPLLKKNKKIGLSIIVLFFLGFGLWSVIAKLDAAAVASGTLVVEAKHQKIQHLEGGIIKYIFVKDGAKVKQGQVLIKLDKTQAGVSLKLVQEQLFEMLALESRLLSELLGKNKIVFHKRLIEKSKQSKIKLLLQGQGKLFRARSEELDGVMNILNQRVKQLEKVIESLQAQINSETKQVKLIDEELKAMLYLDKLNLVEKPKILALKRMRAKLIGDKGEHLGMLAKEEQKIGETKMQMINYKTTRRKDLLKELRETHRQLLELQNREYAAADVLKRTDIVSPVSGVVLGLQKHTPGGVIKPGQDVLSVVPNYDTLAVEARISPLDIDVVHKGLIAKLQISSYKQRSAPRIQGVVDHVSADVHYDKENKSSYYLVKIKLSPKALTKLKGLKVYPGMPVEVMIITDNRSPISYLISPFKDSFMRAFKEQ